MIGVGLFGKIPAQGDFVSMGMASPTGRSFDRWAQMANDRLAQDGRELPPGPLGFCFRDEGGTSLLVGVMVASRDRVGRRFPLSLFCEITTPSPYAVAGVPGVFAPAIARLSELALEAEASTLAHLQAGLATVPVPETNTLLHDFDAEVDRLAEVPLRRVLRRIYGDDGTPAYGMEVLIRAVDKTLREGPRRPTMLDVKATSDVELLFWLACTQARLPDAAGPLSALWDVPSKRALIAAGLPHSNTLGHLCSKASGSAKLWSTSTTHDAAEARARDRLDPELVALLTAPGNAVALDLVTALAPSSASAPVSPPRGS